MFDIQDFCLIFLTARTTNYGKIPTLVRVDGDLDTFSRLVRAH